MFRRSFNFTQKTFFSTSSRTSSPSSTPSSFQNPLVLRDGNKKILLKASSFTNNPIFYETINLLKDIKRRIEAPPPMKRTIIQWFSKDIMSERLGTTLSPIQYRKLIVELNQISHSTKIRDFLKSFSSLNIDNILDDSNQTTNEESLNLATNSLNENEIKMKNFIKKKMQNISLITPKMGKLFKQPSGAIRSRSEGGRKDANAVVHLTPSKDSQNPLIIVNGQNAHDIWGFGSLQEMFMIVEPFSLTGTEGMFDVDAIVTGGGNKGKAGAVANGIARSLALFGKGQCINLFFITNY